jgi:hypothetical protein
MDLFSKKIIFSTKNKRLNIYSNKKLLKNNIQMDFREYGQISKMEPLGHEPLNRS